MDIGSDPCADGFWHTANQIERAQQIQTEAVELINHWF